jgi:CBS domain-containing protein
MKGHARNLMTERVTSVHPGAPLDAIAALMVSGNFGGVPVVDDSASIIGFVSQTDLLGALLRGLGAETCARDVMSHPPIVIDEFAPTEEVMEVLRERQIHHLPVVRNGRLVGIITPHDVLRFFVDQLLPEPPEAG